MPETAHEREAKIWAAVGVYGAHPATGFACCSAHALADAVPDLLAELDRVRTELAKYVGVEPTVADEMAYLQHCLNAVYEVCDQTATQATRWKHPIPEWVLTVRQAADGDRPANPDDKRRRLYLDGKGNAWIDAGQGLDGTQDVMGITDQWQLKTATDVATETGSLHEIGRCW